MLDRHWLKSNLNMQQLPETFFASVFSFKKEGQEYSVFEMIRENVHTTSSTVIGTSEVLISSYCELLKGLSLILTISLIILNSFLKSH